MLCSASSPTSQCECRSTHFLVGHFECLVQVRRFKHNICCSSSRVRYTKHVSVLFNFGLTREFHSSISLAVLLALRVFAIYRRSWTLLGILSIIMLVSLVSLTVRCIILNQPMPDLWQARTDTCSGRCA